MALTDMSEGTILDSLIGTRRVLVQATTLMGMVMSTEWQDRLASRAIHEKRHDGTPYAVTILRELGGLLDDIQTLREATERTEATTQDRLDREL